MLDEMLDSKCLASWTRSETGEAPVEGETWKCGRSEQQRFSIFRWSSQQDGIVRGEETNRKHR